MRCNHTILDYGTFGLWAALLAGGRIIVPAGYRWSDDNGDNDDDGDGDDGDDGDGDDINMMMFFLAARWRHLTWFGGKTRNWKTLNT